MPTSVTLMKLLAAHAIQFPVMEHGKRNDQVFVHVRPRTKLFGRCDLTVPRDPDHVPVRIPDLRGRVRVPEEPGHDGVVSVAFVVVGTFGVGEPDGTGGLEALVGDECARDAEFEFELGFVVPEVEGSSRVNVWY